MGARHASTATASRATAVDISIAKPEPNIGLLNFGTLTPASPTNQAAARSRHHIGHRTAHAGRLERRGCCPASRIDGHAGKRAGSVTYRHRQHRAERLPGRGAFRFCRHAVVITSTGFRVRSSIPQSGREKSERQRNPRTAKRKQEWQDASHGRLQRNPCERHRQLDRRNEEHEAGRPGATKQ